MNGFLFLWRSQDGGSARTLAAMNLTAVATAISNRRLYKNNRRSVARRRAGYGIVEKKEGSFMREIFGENLKRIRAEKAITQEQLAERLGITAQAVSKWECAPVLS